MHDAVARFQFGEAVDTHDAPAAIAAIHRLLALSAEEKAALAANALRYAESMDERRYLAQFF
jgi:acyl transferase domain-containing protein